MLKRVLLIALVLSGFSGFTVTVSDATDSLLFQDDFSDLERSKEIWKSQCGFPNLPFLYLEEGALRMNVLNSGTGISTGSDSWTDYIFNVKIRFIERGGGESNNHAGFNIRGSVTIIGRKNCINYDIAGVTPETSKGLDAEKKKVPLDDGKWHYFRFICKGESINVWADGEEIGTIKQAPVKGGISLYSYNCIVEFDDVSVTKIEE